MTLSEKFENYQVCHATGIELDIIEFCHDFALENIPDYENSGIYDQAIDFMLELKNDSDDLAYFTFEVLQDYMNEHSPIGCYFGSHKGDSTLGYWRILEYRQVGYEYADCQPLPYKESGYVIFGANDCMGDKLASLGSFLEDNYPDQYLYTDLWETIAELTMTDSDSPFETVKFCEKVIDSVVIELLPKITPNHMTWRLNDNNNYGLYPELPSYKIASDSKEKSETILLIHDANLITLLVFIIENRQGHELMKLKFDQNDVKQLALRIIEKPHFKPLYECIGQAASFDKSDMAQYICDDYNLLQWVIETVYWSDFKAQIDRLIGNQDITRLFLDILSHDGSKKINGIQPEEVWCLRESCDDCQDFDPDYDDSDDLDCGCTDCEQLNNVWIVSESSFYKALQSHGAMVYETDSLYLYLQTDHAGNYYDDRLRRAWITYGHMAWLGELL